MEVTVNGQPQRFFLALDKWEPAVGHEIKVGDYCFCAIPLSDSINVSEVKSGSKIFTINMGAGVVKATSTKQGALNVFYMLGYEIKRIIEHDNNFDKRLEAVKKYAVKKLGEKPPIENIEIDNC